MELITSKQASLTRAEPTAALTISNEPWAVAIRAKYGTAENLIRRWAPSQQRYCALQFAKAFRGDELPETVVRITRTFGDEAMLTVLRNQITYAIIRGEAAADTTADDITAIAEAICDSERLRRLTMVSILKFFHRLRCGEYEQLMYGRELSARKILTELNRQFPKLLEEEVEARQLYEVEQQERAEAESKRSAITFKQWAMSTGMSEEEADLGIVHYMQLQKQRWQNEINAAKAFLDILQEFAYIIAVLDDHKEYIRR